MLKKLLFTSTDDLIKKQGRDTYLNVAVASLVTIMFLTAFLIYSYNSKEDIQLDPAPSITLKDPVITIDPLSKSRSITQIPTVQKSAAAMQTESLSPKAFKQNNPDLEKVKNKEPEALPSNYLEIDQQVKNLTPVTPGQKFLLGPGSQDSGAAIQDDNLVGTTDSDCSFLINQPFDVAVPCFVETIAEETANLKDEEELENIALYAEDLRSQLPDFVNDLLVIAQELENQGSPEYVFDQYQAFADNWNSLANNYPGLSELEPVLAPIIDQLVDSLPKLAEQTNNNNPLENLFAYYQQMSIVNPWGLGSLFRLEPLPNEDKRTNVSELSLETVLEGIKTVQILNRETIVTLNGVTVYYELIENDIVVNRYVEFRNPTLIHDILEDMQSNDEDPMLIQAVGELVNIMDTNLAQAVDDGVLDECSLAFINRKSGEYVDESCLDYTNEEQEFNRLVRFDPFDPVNQLSLEAQSSGSEVELNSGLDNVAVLENYGEATENFAGVWILGIIVPTYLWSMFSFIRSGF